MKTLLFTFSLFLVAICSGLAQTNAAVRPTPTTPTSLSQLVASADHIIATNRFGYDDPRYRGFSLTISADEARKTVSAVSNARLLCSPPCTDSMFDWDLQFYRGANLLAVVHAQGSHFMLGDWKKGAEYADSTGVLQKFWGDLEKRTH
jgi:hypothetical protein